MSKIQCGSESVVVARWVRSAIEHAQDVPLVGETRSGVYFYGLFVQSLFICSTFCYIFITCFSLVSFGCVLFSKKESFGMGLSSYFFVLYLSYDLLVILIEKFQIRYTVCSSRYLIFG